MNAKDRAEAAKWLRLGYETYGPDGVASLADAMGVSFPGNAGFARVIEEGVAPANSPASTATSGSATLPSSEWSSPDYKFRYGSLPKVKRPPLACPPTPPRTDEAWRRYDGDPFWFHCGFEGFLERRTPSTDWPIGECFYDRSGRLVDDSHPYAGCKGTPDQFEAKDVFEHTVQDEGGIARSGFPALLESMGYFLFGDEPDRRYEQFKRYRRRR